MTSLRGHKPGISAISFNLENRGSEDRLPPPPDSACRQWAQVETWGTLAWHTRWSWELRFEDTVIKGCRCVPQIHMLKSYHLPQNVMVLGDGPLEAIRNEGAALLNGLGPLQEGPPWELLHLSLCVCREDMTRRQQSVSREAFWPVTESAGTLIFDFQPPELLKVIVCCFSHPVCVFLL